MPSGKPSAQFDIGTEIAGSPKRKFINSFKIIDFNLIAYQPYLLVV